MDIAAAHWPIYLRDDAIFRLSGFGIASALHNLVLC